jgi:integrase
VESTDENHDAAQVVTTAGKRRAVVGKLPKNVSVHRLGNGSFRVRLGKKFTNSKAVLKDFKRLDAAKEWIQEQEKNRMAVREMQLSPEQVAAAKLAFQRLGSIPLSDVVDFYFKAGPGGREAITLAEAMDLYRENHEKSKSADSYIDAQEVSLDLLLATFDDRKKELKNVKVGGWKSRRKKKTEVDPKRDHELTHYSATELDVWLSWIAKDRAWEDLNKLNYLRDLKMFFRFCVRHNHLARNPMEDAVFDWAKTLRKNLRSARKITVFTPTEAEKLLLACWNSSDEDMLPWFAIAFFSGVRVDEIRKLSWEIFRWDEGLLSLSQEDVSKRGDPRYIPINETLDAWLSSIPDVKARTGAIIDTTNWRHRLDALHRQAGVPKKRNALRHTFASNYYVQHGSAKKTRQLLGHRTDDVLFKHYVTLVPKKDAAAFWNLRPPSGKNVQRFANTG